MDFEDILIEKTKFIKKKLKKHSLFEVKNGKKMNLKEMIVENLETHESNDIIMFNMKNISFSNTIFIQESIKFMNHYLIIASYYQIFEMNNCTWKSRNNVHFFRVNFIKYYIMNKTSLRKNLNISPKIYFSSSPTDKSYLSFSTSNKNCTIKFDMEVYYLFN